MFSWWLPLGEATPKQLLQRAQVLSITDILSFTCKRGGVTRGSPGAGLTGEQEGSSPAAGWAGHLPSLPAELLFPLPKRTCLGLCPHTVSPGLTTTSPKSGALFRDAVDGCISPGDADSLAEKPAVLGALRGANYTLIYLDKCKVGLQLVTGFFFLQGRNSYCLLHRQCLSPLI